MKRLLLCALLAAGCVGPAVDAPVATPPDAPTVHPWGLEACEATVAVVPVDGSALEERVPEGYRLLTPEEAGLPPRPGTDAVFGLELFRCASGATLNGTATDLAYGSYFAFVEPPAEQRRDDALFQFLKWETLVPDEPRRAVLAEAGLPVLGGNVDVTMVSTQDQGYAFTGALAFEGEGGFRISGAAAAPLDASQRDFAFREFTPTPDGVAFWDTRVDASDFRIGTVNVAVTSDSWAREVLGEDQVEGLAYGGIVTFYDGSITLP